MSYPTIPCKVILLGEYGVGKTSIIGRFCTNSPCYYSSKTVPYEKYQKNIKFEIWDTCGQEKFRTIYKQFYMDAQVVLLVYDITRKKTIQELVYYWVDQVRNMAPSNILLGVVGNKCDLCADEQVIDKEGFALAKNIGALFTTISALSNLGIDKLFETIGRQILDPSLNYLEEEGRQKEEDYSSKEITLNQVNQEPKKNNRNC